MLDPQKAEVDVVAVRPIEHPAATALGTAPKLIDLIQFCEGIVPSVGQLGTPNLDHPPTSPCAKSQQLVELHGCVFVAAARRLLFASVSGVLPSVS